MLWLVSKLKWTEKPVGQIDPYYRTVSRFPLITVNISTPPEWDVNIKLPPILFATGI